jgi:hypothetical protein
MVNDAVITFFAHSSQGGATLALLPARLLDEYGVAAAILLTLVGTALQLYIPRHEMSAEELIKDGKLTHEEAQRQTRFYRRCATFATCASVVVLVLVLLDLNR